MNTVKVTMILTMSGESYNSNEFKEFKDSIRSGEMQREITDGNKLKISKCKITIIDLR